LVQLPHLRPVHGLARLIFRSSGIALVAAVSAGGLLAEAASEQSVTASASQLTPETFAPNKQRLNGSVVFSGQPGLAAPQGADGVLISLSGLKIDGALPQMADANEAARARLTGKTITVAEIFNATADLQKAYADAGFVLARVILPAQNLRDGGRLRIQVVDGFFEKVENSAAPPRIADRLTALTAPLVGRRGLRLPEIERQILLAGDTYGVSLGSALAAGQNFGATTLILQPEFRPVTGFFAFDNAVSSDLGPVTLSGGLEFNSPLGYGETFYTRLSGAPSGDNANGLGSLFSDDPRLRTLSLGAVVPLGTDGLTFNIEGTDSRTAPDILNPATTSRFERLSVRLFYPFVRSRTKNISGQLSVDRQNDEQFLVAGGARTSLYRDETTVLRASLDGFWQRETSTLQAGATLSQGFSALGAGATAGTPLSRQGADTKFTKLVLSSQYRFALSDTFKMSVSGRVQSSFGDPLVTGEQFGIAGTQEISAFDAGSVKGDSGWVIRAELSMPRQVQFSDTPLIVSPYAFGAMGKVYLEQPTAVEQSSTKASAIGVGVEISAFENARFTASTLRMEYAKGYRNDAQPDDDRFSISASFRF
jgi:hemolysin activation/secretion protein